MLKEKAQIVETFIESDGSQWVWVEIHRGQMCGNCQAEGHCSTNLLADFFAQRGHHRLKLRNTLNAQQGDYIMIGLSERNFLKAALWVYLFPLVSMFSCGLIAQTFFLANNQEVMISTIGGFVGGFLIAHLISRRANQNPHYQPIMLESSFNL
ncbi:MAG: hypothetical protein RIT27_956 [Pseudomonadota bacterium]|jgi:sigma-E factor negative regulatory protein RseC